MRVLSIVAAVFAICAAVPAFAAFTPAVFASLLALVIAAISAYCGELRWSSVVLIVVTVTVLISPVFTFASLRDARLAMFVLIPYAFFTLGYVRGWVRRK